MRAKSFHAHIVGPCSLRKKSLRDTQHMKSVHESQKFPCPQCAYKATLKDNLQTHIKSVHEGLKFKCTQCDYIVTKKTILQKHVKSVNEKVK